MPGARAHRRRAAAYARIRRDKETMTRRKIYHEPERGGLKFEDELISTDIDKIVQQLPRTLEIDADFFFDTCYLYPKVLLKNNRGEIRKEDFFEYVRNLVDYIGERDDEILEKLHARQTELVNFFVENVFTRENVYITSGVLKEIRDYVPIFRHTVQFSGCKKFARKFLRSIEKLYGGAEKNNEYAKDCEDDPLAKILFRKLPSRTPKGILSETDRNLIAVPLASALSDGREKVILTEDRGVGEGLETLKSLTSQNGFAKAFYNFIPRQYLQEVNVHVGGRNNGSIFGITRRYNNFFNLNGSIN